MVEKYGIKVDGIEVYSKNTFQLMGMAKDSNDKSILMINKAFMNSRNLAEVQKFVAQDNFFVARNLREIVTHEYGHSLVGSYADTLKLQKQKGIIGLSERAKHNADEAVAEIFTQYKVYGKASLKTEWIEFFNKYSKVKI